MKIASSRLFTLVAILSCCSLSPVSGASEGQGDMASTKHRHCEEGNNLENTVCMSRELEESDHRLNVVYETLYRALAKPQGLRSAQRAWIAFRDAECQFQNEAMRGGSAYTFSMHLCLVQLTEQRISALEAVMPCTGCVEFKDEFYRQGKEFSLPKRRRIPASGKP